MNIVQLSLSVLVLSAVFWTGEDIVNILPLRKIYTPAAVASCCRLHRFLI